MKSRLGHRGLNQWHYFSKAHLSDWFPQTSAFLVLLVGGPLASLIFSDDLLQNSPFMPYHALDFTLPRHSILVLGLCCLFSSLFWNGLLLPLMDPMLVQRPVQTLPFPGVATQESSQS